MASRVLEIARPALAGPGRENLPLERQENKMPSPAKGIDIKGKQHRETSARIPMTRERVAKFWLPDPQAGKADSNCLRFDCP